MKKSSEFYLIIDSAEKPAHRRFALHKRQQMFIKLGLEGEAVPSRSFRAKDGANPNDFFSGIIIATPGF